MCLECANKIAIFAILERWLLQLRETDSSFVFIIFVVLLGGIWSAAILAFE